MRLKEKITLITENTGNARIWIQGDTDVENHGLLTDKYLLLVMATHKLSYSLQD